MEYIKELVNVCKNLNENLCSIAAKKGNLECLKNKWYENGHLDCLKYAHENGCQWNEDICSEVSKNGHLDCLKYAHENGCPWDEDTCNFAAENGNLECLKYAHKMVVHGMKIHVNMHLKMDIWIV